MRRACTKVLCGVVGWQEPLPFFRLGCDLQLVSWAVSQPPVKKQVVPSTLRRRFPEAGPAGQNPTGGAGRKYHSRQSVMNSDTVPVFALGGHSRREIVVRRDARWYSQRW